VLQFQKPLFHNTLHILIRIIFKMSCAENLTVEYFPEWFCQVIDLEKKDNCAELDHSVCIRCTILGSFFTNERLKNSSSFSHIICVIMWIFTLGIGIIGVFTNLLIIIIIWRMKGHQSFDILIRFLAGFDMLCCASSLIGTTIHVSLYRKENYQIEMLKMILELMDFFVESWAEKDYTTMLWFYLSTLSTLFGMSHFVCANI